MRILIFTLIISAGLGLTLSSTLVAENTENAANTENVSDTTERTKAQRPLISVLGHTVTPQKALIMEKINAALPASLTSASSQKLLTKRIRPQFFEHTPTRGNAAAPLQVIEFIDLSAPESRTFMQQLDTVLAHYNGNYYLAHIGVSADPTHAQGAFYARIAAREDKFWDYRDAIIRAQGEPNYLALLREVNVPEITIRNAIINNTDSIYTELDADNALWRKLKLTSMPAVLVNGVAFSATDSNNTLPLDVLESFIDYELYRIEKSKGFAD